MRFEHDGSSRFETDPLQQLEQRWEYEKTEEVFLQYATMLFRFEEEKKAYNLLDEYVEVQNYDIGFGSETENDVGVITTVQADLLPKSFLRLLTHPEAYGYSVSVVGLSIDDIVSYAKSNPKVGLQILLSTEEPEIYEQLPDDVLDSITGVDLQVDNSRNDSEELDQLLTLPLMRNVRSINLGHYTLNLQAFLGSEICVEAAKKWKHVSFENADFEDDDITDLLSNEFVGNWVSVDFSMNIFSSESIKTIAGCDYARNWRYVDFYISQYLDDMAVEYLIGTDVAKQWKAVNLGLCRLTSKGIGALVASPVVDSWRFVDLSSNEIGLAGAEKIADSQFVEHWRKVGLSYADLNDQALGVLLDSDHVKSWSKVSLVGNPITDSGAQMMTDSETVEHWKEIDIDETEITDEGKKLLNQSPRTKGKIIDYS